MLLSCVPEVCGIATTFQLPPGTCPTYGPVASIQVHVENNNSPLTCSLPVVRLVSKV